MGRDDRMKRRWCVLTVLAPLVLTPALQGQVAEDRVAELEARVAALEEALARLSTPTPGVALVVPPTTENRVAPILIGLVRKTFFDGIQDQIQFEFRFTSRLDNPVRAFTGVVVLQDLFERDIMRVTLTVEEPLRPRGTVTYEGGIDYNQFMDSHQRLNSIAPSDLVTKFELEMVIFQDGTRESFSRELESDRKDLADATADEAAEQYRGNVAIEDLRLTQNRSFFGDSISSLAGRVRNTGDKTLQRVRIIVYFLDDQGDAIGEKEFIPVFYRDGQISLNPDVPLRPNYVKDFSYSLEDAPSTWRGLGYRVELVSIEFLD